MPLANDDASAAARGRHVGVATRSSSSSSNSTSSNTYVADQCYSPPAGHPRALERSLSPSSYHLLLLPAPGTYNL